MEESQFTLNNIESIEIEWIDNQWVPIYKYRPTSMKVLRGYRPVVLKSENILDAVPKRGFLG